MKRYIQSEGFLKLNLPKEVLDQCARHAKQEKAVGKGQFKYVAMSIMCGIQAFQVVVSVVEKPIDIGNITALRGDVVFHLRSEWNKHENPLD